MSKVYHIDIAVNDVPVANAYGNARIVGFVAKSVVKELTKDESAKASVALTQVDGIGGDTIATIMDITADAISVGKLLRWNLTAINKAEKAENAEENEDEDEDTETENPVSPVDSGVSSYAS